MGELREQSSQLFLFQARFLALFLIFLISKNECATRLEEASVRKELGRVFSVQQRVEE